METKLLYMDHWDVITAQAKILAIVEQDGQKALVLDQTIFYPQGGGQPADRGEIVGTSGLFQVAGVRFVDGVVYHFGEFAQGTCAVGEAVELKIDQQRRELLSRLHSAGHLIDVAMEQLGCHFVAGKGYHFADHPYVEYEANLTAEDCIGLQKELQVVLDDLVQSDIPITGVSMAREDLEKVCQHVPDYLPAGKPIHIVTIGNHTPCPCGGTHVRSSSLIGRIKISKIKSKGGVLRVSYQLAAM